MSPQSLNDNFTLFIGIDQTGAVGARGFAKPMPVAIFDGTRLQLTKRDGSPLEVSSFTKKGFTDLSRQAEIDPLHLFSSQTCLFVDGVFGLAAEVWSEPPGLQGLRNYFTKAAAFPGYGLKTAAAYFESLRPIGTTEFFVRRCELITKANSVFRTHPFQRNIQCGTFRIWKDLGSENEPWYQVRYFTPQKEVSIERPWIFEAYPSLMWREHFGFATRKPHELARAIEKKIPRLKWTKQDRDRIAQSPDAADAAVLAVSAYLEKEKGHLFSDAPSRKSWLSREGWIIGSPARFTSSTRG